MAILKYLILIFFILKGLANTFSQDHNWELIQTIPSGENKIHSITYADNKLAVNIDNSYIEIYEYINEQFQLSKTFKLRHLTPKFGTMKFVGSYLYVSIDGFKFYKIDLVNEKIRRTNTYKAGFYIISVYDVEYYGKYWVFKINKNKDLEIYINKIYKEVIRDNINPINLEYQK